MLMFIQSVPEGVSFFYFILRVGENKDLHTYIYMVVTCEILLQMNKPTVNIESGASCTALKGDRNILAG